jgi:hypothetical protein
MVGIAVSGIWYLLFGGENPQVSSSKSSLKFEQKNRKTEKRHRIISSPSSSYANIIHDLKLEAAKSPESFSPPLTPPTAGKPVIRMPGPRPWPGPVKASGSTLPPHPTTRRSTGFFPW